MRTGSTVLAAATAAVAGGLLLGSMPATTAAWTDVAAAEAPAGSVTALDLPEPVLACDGGGSSVTISWDAATTPTVLDYAVFVDGNLVQRANGLESVELTSGLLGTLLGGLLVGSYEVTVIAELPGTAQAYAADPVTQIVENIVIIGLSCG